MEATGEANIGSLLDKINPPLLEDAGLEDCALHPDSIQEAFLKAATAVRSHVFHDSDDESEGDCIEDPWPGNEFGGDRLVGITTETDPPGACAPKKGGELPEVIGDEVVIGEREGGGTGGADEAEKSCVDGLRGLKMGDTDDKKSETNKKLNEDEEDDEKRIPVLTEVCI
uniref:Uncharacterized protein n=1 Tax=Lactuca sativa TaxID=4236 RepID=A0A9R1VGS4_LACSA|nr:hypothetical protein LSAT_V11C500276650 [Lactuca sativa]